MSAQNLYLGFLGAKVELSVNAPDSLAKILEIFPQKWLKDKAHKNPDFRYQFLAGKDFFQLNRLSDRHWHSPIPHSMIKIPSEDHVLAVLEESILAAPAFADHRHYYVQGGAVALNGKNIAVVAPRLSGVSSLIKALGEAGANVLTDRWLPFDDNGRFCPLPGSLCSIGQTLRFRVPRLAGSWPRRRIRPDVLIFSQYSSKHPVSDCTSVTRGRMVANLMDAAMKLNVEKYLPYFSNLSQLPGWSLHYSQEQDAISQLRQISIELDDKSPSRTSQAKL
jgi:hypothetical protein